MAEMHGKTKIVIIIPRGEAVRNFVYSDTLDVLSEHAEVTLFSVVTDPKFFDRFKHKVQRIVPIEYVPEHPIVNYLRHFLHEAHFRWMWTGSARNKWAVRDAEAKTVPQKIKRLLEKAIILPLANRPMLELFTRLENYFTLALKRTTQFDELYEEIQPDLVFNGSHIHGAASFLPIRVANKKGITTAGFVFSWDNLTNRSRIFEPYDHFVVWNEKMKRQLLGLYPFLTDQQIHIAGTPQFDFHFQDQYLLSKEELAKRLGLDSSRPIILYTTGIDRHFPDEHKHVESVIRTVNSMNGSTKPQLVVRTYVKGTSEEMKELARQDISDVVFPDVQWEEQWFTPMYEDLEIYSSLIRYAEMGINPASTVSLEFMMFDKPVVNIGYNPPGSNIPPYLNWKRHIDRDHYRPVADSGATMIAYSDDDLDAFIKKGLAEPALQSKERRSFIAEMFGDTLDGNSGKRVAEKLLTLARQKNL